MQLPHSTRPLRAPRVRRSPVRGRPAVLLAGLLLLTACDDPEPAPPSLVMIVVDTLRADLAEPVVGELRTPTLDRLYERGVRFPNAFSHAPMTLPAHASLFASRPPHATGVFNNGQVIPARLPLLAEHLRDLGFDTRAVISLASLESGLSSGFDRYTNAAVSFIASGEQVNARLGATLDDLDPERPFFLFAHFSDPHEPYNAHREEPKTATVQLDDGEPERVTTSTISRWYRTFEVGDRPARIEVRSDKRFRLRAARAWGPGPEPGVRGERLLPRYVEGGLKVPQKRAVLEIDPPPGGPGPVTVELVLCDHPLRAWVPIRYGREVEYVDAQVGRLLEQLDARGLLDDAVLVFTSDHGEALGARDGFVGHVRNLHDELLRVPLVIQPPDPGQAARLAERADEVVGHVDVVPTVLELMGLPPLPGQQGRSLLAPPEAPPTVVAETRRPEALSNQASIQDERYKLVYHAEEQRFEMFDLVSDPGELVDVFELRGPERAAWQDRLRRVVAAALELEARQPAPALGPDALENLQALGYLGDE